MSATETPAPSQRILSVDAFRGLVMLLMMDSALRIGDMAKNFPDDPVWQTLAFHTDHVKWTGCSLHDLIQPAFSFLVGVSLPFSIANREARGHGFGWMFGHAVWRGLLLMFLGIFLRSMGAPITNWSFMDTLTQIGMGYVILFLLAFTRSQLVCWITVVLILVGYWCAFAFYPLPPENFDYAAVNVKSNEPGRFEGFLAHWNKNANMAADFDKWFLNQFPRKAAKKDAKGIVVRENGKVVLEDVPFTHERSGYTTLNFVPTLATMLLGVIAGMWLRKEWSHEIKMTAFLIASTAGLGLGMASEYFEVCPIVKIIWTPAWTLYSAGWTFLFLASFYLLIDYTGWWHWAFPLFVVGANSIVAYCAYHTIRPFIVSSFHTHLGTGVFKFLDGYYDVAWEPMVTGVFVLLTMWLLLFWMYRNKVLVRI